MSLTVKVELLVVTYRHILKFIWTAMKVHESFYMPVTSCNRWRAPCRPTDNLFGCCNSCTAKERVIFKHLSVLHSKHYSHKRQYSQLVPDKTRSLLVIGNKQTGEPWSNSLHQCKVEGPPGGNVKSAVLLDMAQRTTGRTAHRYGIYLRICGTTCIKSRTTIFLSVSVRCQFWTPDDDHIGGNM
jgi:hypothetical protein